MTKAEAATYCGLTPSGLSTWVKAGRLPGPVPGTRRWDRAAIDAALDKLSGIATKQFDQPEENEADRWLRDYEAKQAREQPATDDTYSHISDAEILRRFKLVDPRSSAKTGKYEFSHTQLPPRVQAVLKKEAIRRGIPWED
ncbi:helix-turn-helix transcriptional regulator [Microvirga thermotolerans]|uniref:helix-turn-helix transcriptional regulator n=1 Tax=Microvirga thermotolerans TaxID=2651334 RepID=UPI0018835C23|nr:helix-turn-helix domain-containing protein [Microvirga thermotolerans]